MGKATNIFFLGKGGVGKSTSAALNSICLAQKDFKVIIVSFDPAHNQSDPASFLPPAQIPTGNATFYISFLTIGLVLICLIPFVILKWKKPLRNKF